MAATHAFLKSRGIYAQPTKAKVGARINRHCFVYALVRSDCVVPLSPFYCGATNYRQRLSKHINCPETELSRNPAKCQAVKQCVADGCEVMIAIFALLPREAARKLEARLIKFYGDCLTNTLGSREYRQNISRGNRRRFSDPSERQQAGERLAARWADPAYRTKQTAVTKARWEDPDYHAKQVVDAKARWDDPEYRTKTAEAQRIGRERYWANYRAQHGIEARPQRQTVKPARPKMRSTGFFEE